MKTLFTQTTAVKRIFQIVLTATVVILCGCSQEIAKRNLVIGQASWTQLDGRIAPEAVTEKPPIIKAETFLATGRLLESQGNFVEAAKLYQRACRARLDYVAAWTRLGIVCDKLGRYEQAEEAFSQGINHAPKAAFLHNNLGFSCLLAGKYEEAEKHLRRALELNGQFQRARVNLGVALAKQGEMEAAFVELKKALPTAQAHYNMGYLYRQDRQWDKAGDSYKLALELDPDLSEAKTSLALCEQGFTAEK